MPLIPSEIMACNKSLGALNQRDTRVLAGGLLCCLKYEGFEMEAVERFISSFLPMNELYVRYPVFKTVMANLAKSVFADQQEFARVKLFGAAFLSMADMFTGILMIMNTTLKGAASTRKQP